MVDPSKFIDALERSGVDFYAGVPDSLLKNFCARLADTMPAGKHIIAANEGNAVGLAAGHFLATGHLPMVYMQNSGLGNTVNPLLSLMDTKVYSLPVLLLIGWRGEPGKKDEPQHARQGEVTIDLLDAMRIPYIILSDDEDEAIRQASETALGCARESRPHAVVVRKGTFADYKLTHRAGRDFPMSREEALKIVAGRLPQDAVTVSTTGKLSRELFEFREAQDCGHGRDFLTVGSMGHASSIALGIALAQPERPVYCLDGDGAALMHLGAMSNIGLSGAGNYTHIIFNNGAHESVGAQPTVALDVDLPAVASACGYRSAVRVDSEEELRKALEADAECPRLIEICVAINSRSDLGRPTATPQQNRDDFMKFLSK